MALTLDNLADAIQCGTHCEHLAGDDVVPITKKGKRETTDPVNKLLAMLKVSFLHHLCSCEETIPLLPDGVGKIEVHHLQPNVDS